MGHGGREHRALRGLAPGGAVVGVSQSLVLTRQFPRVGSWALAAFVSWPTVGLVVGGRALGSPHLGYSGRSGPSGRHRGCRRANSMACPAAPAPRGWLVGAGKRRGLGRGRSRALGRRLGGTRSRPGHMDGLSRRAGRGLGRGDARGRGSHGHCGVLAAAGAS